MNCSVKPYEGKRPYLFISYSHKDAARVYPILEALAQRGFRLWYDSGIEGGADWINSLIKHISGCAAALVFVSPNFASSRNCMNEVNHMVTKNRPIIPLLLENFNPPDRLAFQLGTNNYIILPNASSPDQIVLTLYGVPEVMDCSDENTFRLDDTFRLYTPSGNVPPYGLGKGNKKKKGGGLSTKGMIIAVAAAGVVVLAASIALVLAAAGYF